MSALITDAMVEAAAIARWDYEREEPGDIPAWEMRSPSLREFDTEAMRAALEAAVPAIAAKALRDAADEVRSYAYQPDDVSGPFPADQQPAYLAGATDAHHVADRLILARADRIEARDV